MSNLVRADIKERQSNLEVLRIISMVLIVAHHFQLDRDFERDENGLSVHPMNEFTLNLLHSGGKVGVNIFMLLSGYFLKDQGVKPKALIKTWVQTIMWSHIILFAEFFRRPLYTHDYLYGLFPVMSYSYWYVSAYFTVMLLSPIITHTVSHASDLRLILLLVTMFVTMSVLDWPDCTAYCNIMWLVFVSLLGASLKRFERLKESITLKFCASALILSLFCSISSIYYFITYPTSNYAQRYGGYALTFDIRSPMSLILSVLAFLVATKTSIQSCYVNAVAGCTFGVYLIHESPFLRYDIWHTIMQTSRYQDEATFPAYALLDIFTVYISCSALELLRQNLFVAAEIKATSKIEMLLLYVEAKYEELLSSNEKMFISLA